MTDVTEKLVFSTTRKEVKVYIEYFGDQNSNRLTRMWLDSSHSPAELLRLHIRLSQVRASRKKQCLQSVYSDNTLPCSKMTYLCIRKNRGSDTRAICDEIFLL